MIKTLPIILIILSLDCFLHNTASMPLISPSTVIDFKSSGRSDTSEVEKSFIIFANILLLASSLSLSS